MWYFMAGMEQHYKQISGINCDFGLTTFYKIGNQEKFEKSIENINHILIDSGAYSFRHGATAPNFDEFCNNYKNFIKRNKDNEKIVGFFELDIDNIVGYEKVLEYREILESVSDKIIPVWHQNRGISEFIKMCKNYSGKRVAVATVGWHDMYPEQLNLFINTAHKYGCKIHVLGMTSKDIIEHSNLGLEDSFDSVGWALASAFSNVKLNIKNDDTYTLEETFARLPGVASPKMNVINYLSHRKIQAYYKGIDQSVEVE